MFSKQTKETLPNHIGIIMDGNGRWAEKRNLSRSNGHKKGLENIKNICESAMQSQTKFLTLFSLSSENLFRSKEEILFLINLVDHAIEYYKDFIFKNRVIFNFFGDTSILNKTTISKIQYLQNETNERFFESHSLILNIAFNYGGKQEILFAINKFLSNLKLQNLKNQNVQMKEDDLTKNFYIPNLPDPDLIIRTGKYQRLSNFLLWQSAYSELYFSQKLWPDFSDLDFRDAINFFQNQQRNFGLVNEN